MKTIHFHSHTEYGLLEFHYYIDDNNVSVIELLLNTSNLSTIEKDFSNIFIVDTDIGQFILSDYEVAEAFLDNNLVRVVCVK